jgi:uncharacterized membrane protein YraQ (UPF0718 family)
MLAMMFLLAAIATLVAARRGVVKTGMMESVKLLVQVGPVLLPAFILAGMMSVVLTPDMLTRWLGQEAGARGLAVGTIAGALTPGGPFVAFPLLAVLLDGGASVGAVTAYLSSWALLGMNRVLAFEIPILGWRFVLCRVLASAAFPAVIGAVAQLLWARTPGGR